MTSFNQPMGHRGSCCVDIQIQLVLSAEGSTIEDIR